ncbi:MAG: cation-translocating P-type ATPase [Brevundimonas sp.]|jgi:Ca2+-transporting ATPase|uniref:cation-translocating P-type ATPase n=1 Tax=Brevundimonas sp. TaxID=1871086 RepID=UPI0025C7242A|nr:cation-translocating P-type ATPase [Brevundimonas sp.]MCH4267274.1 cation-translocating P-type ATPase [Brevundimonas sp.]
MAPIDPLSEPLRTPASVSDAATSGAPLVAAGLDEAEAVRRLARFGPNEIRKPRSRNLTAIIAGALREPMILLLLTATGLYLVFGHRAEGLFLAAGAFVSVSLTVGQEARSERALKALRAMAEPTARVLREGQERRLPARDLVPGDVVLVGEGERVPADLKLTSSLVVTVDESLLTGEAVPATRSGSAFAGPPPARACGGDGGPWLFAGTLIVAGHGLAEVVETGPRTAMGRVGEALGEEGEPPTPLQKATRRLVGVTGLLAVGFCAVVAVLYAATRQDALGGALAGLTLAIALIPEEFPMVLTVFMALGARRLAQKHVLVRRTAVVEALGGASLLCVDKTGTLTENRMRLAAVWTYGRRRDVAPGHLVSADGALLEAAVRACARPTNDPMDRALIEADGSGAEVGEPVRVWPLESGRPAYIQLWREGDGFAAGAKGAPEAVFSLCGLEGELRGAAAQAQDDMAREGLRVLAVAGWRGSRPFDGAPEGAGFGFLGLVAFEDPLRCDVPEALRLAQAAGVSVAMITGDYPATARAIAGQAGIDLSGGVLTGGDVETLTPAALRERLAQVRVFARIRPEQKLALVDAFQANGHVVAMTGDGVNDAPALEAAQIGIAMGQRGSDVAREAADLVLLDDSFGALVGGVALGRRIYANLRKAMVYITAIHVPIAGLALAPLLLGWPPLLMPMHVVLLELVIDPVCALAFEAAPGEAAAMKRPPRKPDEALFGRRQILGAARAGALLLGVLLLLYGGSAVWLSVEEARGAAFAGLVVANLAFAFAASSVPGQGLLDRSRRSFWLICILASAVLCGVLAIPAWAELFSVAVPPPVWLTIALTVGAGVGALAFRLTAHDRA